MTLFVDSSVWSLVFRRDTIADEPQVVRLHKALDAEEVLVATGLVIQELLQGVKGPKGRELLLTRLSAIPLIPPKRQDHIEAALLHNHCRKNGVQCGSIDILIAQLCIRSGVELLTADKDFLHIAKHCKLRLWQP